MIKVAVIGFGKWGPNLARNFQNSRHFEIKHIVEKSKKNTLKAKLIYPLANFYKNYRLLNNKEIDLVIIATPTSSHFKIASYFLKKNNVLVEKPLSTSLNEVNKLEKIGKKFNKLLFVDYPFLFSGSINYLKEIISKKKFGKLIGIESYREQAPVRHDTNVIWDLTVHDISVLIYLINRQPKKIFSYKLKSHQSKKNNTAYINLEFDKKLHVFIKNSWIAPKKIRVIKFEFEKCFIVCDENEPLYKIKIYRKRNNSELNYNIQIPDINISEPLFNLTEYVFKCLKSRNNMIFKNSFNAKITKILEKI
jgi:predicted dehydrogenase